MTRMPEAVERDVVAGPGAEGARRATGGPGPVTTSGLPAPDPEVPATVQRRRFSAAYRLRILKPKFQRPKQGNPLSVSMITGFNLQAYWVQSVMT